MKSWKKIVVRALLLALAVALFAGYKIGFGHPFTINQLANRQALHFFRCAPGSWVQCAAVRISCP